MDRLQLCLRRIDQVRAAATGTQSAYLLRARTNRMLLSVQQVLAAEYGLQMTAPALLKPAKSRSSLHEEVAVVCNRILLESKSLSQRSAALDTRWREGWRILSTDVDELERLLTMAQGSPETAARRDRP